MISGALAGITGVFMMFRTGGANNMLGKGFEMRVIMALLLGSVPVVGGMDSKMFKVVIGALTVLSLENGTFGIRYFRRTVSVDRRNHAGCGMCHYCIGEGQSNST